jgi:hypothetical protein
MRLTAHEGPRSAQLSKFMVVAAAAATALVLGTQVLARVTPFAVQPPHAPDPNHFRTPITAPTPDLPPVAGVSETQIRANLQTVGYTDVSPLDILLVSRSATGPARSAGPDASPDE